MLLSHRYLYKLSPPVSTEAEVPSTEENSIPSHISARDLFTVDEWRKQRFNRAGISSKATQKLGMDWPSTAKRRRPTSMVEPLFRAAMVPRGQARRLRRAARVLSSPAPGRACRGWGMNQNSRLPSRPAVSRTSN